MIISDGNGHACTLFSSAYPFGQKSNAGNYLCLKILECLFAHATKILQKVGNVRSQLVKKPPCLLPRNGQMPVYTHAQKF